MSLFFGVVIAFLCCMVNDVESKKKLPSGMSQHQYCHGCLATMKELEKGVAKALKKSSSREVAVLESMEKICTPPNFVTYDYSPPKTVKACQVLLENNEEQIESALVKGATDVTSLICHELSGACNGVDLTKDKEKKFSDIDLTTKGGEATTKTVQLDGSGKPVVEEEQKKKATIEGKTLSKTDKKKKKKKRSKKDKKGEPAAKPAEKVEPSKPGQKQKGALHNLNIDINDPSSLERVMAQINELKQKYSEEAKDEL